MIYSTNLLIVTLPFLSFLFINIPNFLVELESFLIEITATILRRKDDLPEIGKEDEDSVDEKRYCIILLHSDKIDINPTSNPTEGAHIILKP